MTSTSTWTRTRKNSCEIDPAVGVLVHRFASAARRCFCGAEEIQQPEKRGWNSQYDRRRAVFRKKNREKLSVLGASPDDPLSGGDDDL